jgi:hypothetical protein
MQNKNFFHFYVFIFATLLHTTTFGQSYKVATEVGVFGGGSYYVGELNKKHFIASSPAAGVVYRYNFTKRFNVRVTGMYGEITGTDAASNNQNEINRNLNFSSTVLELGVGGEINWFDYRITDMKYPISPYFFYQFAYTRINPTTTLNGNEVDLQPLGTEGQQANEAGNRPYQLNQFTIPLGIGVKINVRDRLAISVEYGIRKTFTDYLDDVSGSYMNSDQLMRQNGPIAAELANRSVAAQAGMNRGNSSDKDWYAFYGVMVTFNPFKRDICKEMRWR